MNEVLRYLDKAGVAKLIELLKQYYYTKGQIDDLLAGLELGDGSGPSINLSEYVKKNELLWEGNTENGIKVKNSGNTTQNSNEVAIGSNNNSSKGSNDTENTLFSVGNSDDSSSKHNAFEVKKSGDILIPDTKNPLHNNVVTNKKPMLNLQEKLKELELPDGGLTGQILTLTENGVAWENAPVQEAPETKPIEEALWEKDTNGSKTGIAPKGRNNVVTGNFSFTGGYMTEATGVLGTTFGQGTVSQNKLETSFCQFNNSKKHSTTFGDSDNTLFTVGNGSGTSTRHNAFEIRENGDIYIPDIVEGVNFYQQGMRRLQDIPKAWKGTWHDFSQLTELDDNTMYYIYEDSIKTLYPEDQLTNFGSYKPVNEEGIEFELLQDKN